MKILLATHWTIPQSIGGLWPFIINLKNGLEKQGHFVDILGQNEDGTGYTLYNQKHTIFKSDLLPLPQIKLDDSFNHRSLTFYNYEFDKIGFELAAAYFNVNNYDIIHAQDVIAASSLRKIIKKQTPIVTSIHGSLPLNIYHSTYGNTVSPPEFSAVMHEEIYQYNMYIEKIGLLQSDFIHTPSNWARDLIIKNYQLNSSSIATFPYGIDTPYMDLSNKQVSNDKKIITFTGRLVPIKGLPILISALERLKSERNDWVCWIVGDGELMNSLRSIVAEKLLQDEILFLGQKNDVFSILHQSDIFVLPSLQDNQPFSIMEAQLAGLPSVATTAGGIMEMVSNGSTGFLIPPGDSHSLFNKLKILLENAPLRRKMSEAAIEFGKKNWSLDIMIQRTLKLYSQAINK